MTLTNNDIVQVHRPANLEQLDAIVRSTRVKVTYVAGATDIMVDQARWQSAGVLINLNTIPEMHQTITTRPDGVLIGAAVPLTRLMHHPDIKTRLPILVEACRQIGSVQIQNRATLGGNIANASPAGDSLPVLSVLDAEIWIGPGRNDEFTKLRLDQVMTGPGQTSLEQNCYIAYIFIPFPLAENQFWYFRKVGQRKSLAISKVSLAILGWKSGKNVGTIRITPGSVTPQIKRAVTTENFLSQKYLTGTLINQASQMLMSEIEPITDIRSTTEYRKWVCGELLKEGMFGIMGKMQETRDKK